MTPAQVAHDLIVTAIDLTRACAAHELYTVWLNNWMPALNGSAGIANYLFLAAVAFEEQTQPRTNCDPFVAREIYADILMASGVLSSDELRDAVKLAQEEAFEEDSLDARLDDCDSQNQNHGVVVPLRIPATHPKFEVRP